MKCVREPVMRPVAVTEELAVDDGKVALYSVHVADAWSFVRTVHASQPSVVRHSWQHTSALPTLRRTRAGVLVYSTPATEVHVGFVGEGVGEGVGVFGPVHVTGGSHGPVLRHAGHCAPFVQSGFGESPQYPRTTWSLMAQMPGPAPVSVLFHKRLRMCARRKR